MFLGLQDPDPDPLVRGTVWIRIRILPSSCKNSKKILDSFYFVALLSLKNDVMYPQKVISRKNRVKN
jgi:hypothetical protein